MRSSRRLAKFSVAVVLAFLAALALVPALAVTYSITLQTDQPAYSGTQAIVITGTVSPAPGPSTAVIISITNAAGSLADIDEAVPDPGTGAFSYTSHPGGNPAWTTGTFTVNATWGGNGETATKLTTFSYTAAASSSSSSSSSSTSSSSSSSSASSSSSGASSSSSSSTSSSSSQVPEFPTGALAVLALIAVALVAALSRRLAPRPVGGAAPAKAA